MFEEFLAKRFNQEKFNLRDASMLQGRKKKNEGKVPNEMKIYDIQRLFFITFLATSIILDSRQR